MVLPQAVWWSIRPSPVSTRSAPSTFSAKPLASSRMRIPGRSSAPRKAKSPAPKPPAAPAPGWWRTSRPTAFSISSIALARFASSSPIISGVAPFCGPNMAVQPRGPSRGLSTSHATSIRLLLTAGWSCDKSMLASSANRPPVIGSRISLPSARRNLMPSAWAMPAPRSFVAEPPIPRIKCLAPMAKATLSSSPVP